MTIFPGRVKTLTIKILKKFQWRVETLPIIYRLQGRNCFLISLTRDASISLKDIVRSFFKMLLNWSMDRLLLPLRIISPPIPPGPPNWPPAAPVPPFPALKMIFTLSTIPVFPLLLPRMCRFELDVRR